MSFILEQLEEYGHIVITEKEDNCYCIFTDKPYQVAKLLKKNKIDFTSEPMYDESEGKKQTWMVDFQL